MTTQIQPAVGACGFCSDGSLRLQRCRNCDRVVAACDGCGRMWEDIAELSRDANISSDSEHPSCPACGLPTADFVPITKEEAEDEGLSCYLQEM